MNDDVVHETPRCLTSASLEPEATTLGMSSVYKLFEAFIALREKNERQHKLFEQTLARMRDNLQGSFNTFAADTQKAYQQLKQDVQGDKRASLTYLNELLELGLELQQIVAARPRSDGMHRDIGAWMDAVEVQSRKVHTMLQRHGIHPYDAVIGSPYNPALHERVGSRRVDGLEALRIAEQVQPGYASQQPDFVLRRAKVIITD